MKCADARWTFRFLFEFSIVSAHSACVARSHRAKRCSVKKFLVVLLVACSVGTFVDVANAQLPPGSIMTTGTAHSHFLSIPLSQMLTCPVAIGPAVPGPVTKPGGNFLSDPIVSFDGLHVGKLPAGDDCSLGGFASDDSGAVGFNHYVQVVNTAIAVYDKSGNVLAGPVSTTTFWENQPDCGGNQIWSDSVVPFDRYANRWVIARPAWYRQTVGSVFGRL